MAQSIDIAYRPLHNPAAKGVSLMPRPVFALVALCLVVSCCLLITAPGAAQEPVRLGVLTIRSGPIASCGRQMEAGLRWALKERITPSMNLEQKDRVWTSN